MNKLLRSKPYFPEEDVSKIVTDLEKVVRSGMFIQGKFVTELENKFSEMCGTKFAIATNSGATALEVAIRATGVTGKQIIVPTQTFVASVSAIIRSGNIPVIVDVDEDTHSLSKSIIEKACNTETFAVMWIHMTGFITPDYYNIKKFCEDRGLYLFEDAAHAVGATIDGISAGNLGYAGCFSLFATKIITSGEGGMITTNHKSFADECRIIRNHGCVRNVEPAGYEGLDFGVNCTWASSNYRMPELSAVVGLHQMPRVKEFVKKRNDIADVYNKRITNPRISKMVVPTNIVTPWWQYIISIKDVPSTDLHLYRTQLCKRLLNEFNIPTANAYWPPCHKQPAFLKYIRSEDKYPVTDSLLNRHLSLPMYVEMTIEQAEYVSDVVNKII